MTRVAWGIAVVVTIGVGGTAALAGAHAVLAGLAGVTWGAGVLLADRLRREDSRLLTGRGLSDRPTLELLVPTVGANAGALLGVGLAPIPNESRLGIGFLVLGIAVTSYAAGTLTGVDFERALREE